MSIKYALPAMAAAVLLSTTAYAASLTKTGEIKTIDTAKHELTLSTGDTFQIGKKVHAKRLKVGEKVVVTYKIADGKQIAKHVHEAK